MKDRLAFEKWLSNKGIAANYAGDGEYDSPRVQLAWEAWFEVSEQARALLAVRDAEFEAIGAGGVSSQRITGTDARWYAVSADGMATLCATREDARNTAAEAAQLYPNNAPYTAVQMVPVGEGEAFGGKS